MKPLLKMTGLLALAIAFAAGTALGASHKKPTGDPAFLPAGAELEQLVNGDDNDLVFAEGPVVTCDNRVLWSDITFTSVKKGPQGGLRAGNIMEYHPATGDVTVFRSPSGMSNGLRIDLNCDLLAAEGADYGGRRITRTDLDTGRAYIVAGRHNGRKFNAPNDIVVDSKGRIYFSDPHYLGQEPIEQPAYCVYRIDPDLSTHCIINNAGKPNGVAVSPDEDTLYVATNDDGVFDFQRIPADRLPGHKGSMALLKYDLDSEGNASNRTVLKSYLPEDGPDGMIIDADGDIWTAIRDQTRPGIYAYEVNGDSVEEKAYIPTPIPTNVHFGRGDDSNYLYITAGNSLYGIETNKEGHHLQ